MKKMFGDVMAGKHLAIAAMLDKMAGDLELKCAVDKTTTLSIRYGWEPGTYTANYYGDFNGGGSITKETDSIREAGEFWRELIELNEQWSCSECGRMNRGDDRCWC